MNRPADVPQSAGRTEFRSSQRSVRRRRVGVGVALLAGLALVTACDNGKTGDTTPINPDKCFTVMVPGPVDGNGNVTPPGSTVPLDVCETQ